MANFRTLITLLLFLLILLSSCAKPSVTSVIYRDGLGYQYNIASHFCRTQEFEKTIEFYCPEGKLILEIISNDPDQGPQELLAKYLNETTTSDIYLADDKKSDHDTVIYSLEAEDLTRLDLDHNGFPIFVATSDFDKDNVFLAKGFLYHEQYALKFEDIFFSVVKSFEPYHR